MLEILSSLISSAIFFGLPIYLIYNWGNIFKDLPDRMDLPQNFSVAMVLFLIVFNLGIYSSNDFPMMGFAVLQVSIAISAILLNLNRFKSKWFISLCVISSLAAMALPFRSNGMVQSINLILIYVCDILLLVYTIDTQSPQLAQTGSAWIKSIFSLIPGTFRNGLIFLKQIIHLPRQGQKGSVMTIIKTVILSFIALVFFSSLLSSADPIFAQYIEEFMDEIYGRTFASIMFTILIAILLASRTTHKSDHNYQLSWLSVQDIAIPSAIVITLFAGFLIIQVQYLFATGADLSVFKLTFSEYVRKGFSELLTTTFFGSMLIYALILKMNTEISNREKNILKAIHVVLVIELLFLLASALKRDMLYIDAYGITRIRLIGGVFLAWLSVSLGALFTLGLKKVSEVRFMQILWGTAIMGWMWVNVVNIDQIIVNAAPAHHKYTDHFYLVNLSPDALEGWKSSLEAMQEEIKPLLTKENPTKEEKAQIAGIKLALISIQERRNKFLKQYAPNDWLLDNDNYQYVFGYNKNTKYREVVNNTEFYGYHKEPNQVNNSDTKCKNADNENETEEDCLKNRQENIDRSHVDWQEWQFANHRAFTEIFANKPLYFNTVDSLVNTIRSWQNFHQVSLHEEERTLLYDFEYQFITINLNYYPEDLEDLKHYNYDYDGKFNAEYKAKETSDKDSRIDEFLAQNKYKIIQISTDKIPGNQDLEMYVFIKKIGEETMRPSSNVETKRSIYRIYEREGPYTDIYKFVDGTNQEKELTIGKEMPSFVKVHLTRQFLEGYGPRYVITDWQEINVD